MKLHYCNDSQNCFIYFTPSHIHTFCIISAEWNLLLEVFLFISQSLFLLGIYSITTSMYACNYTQEADSIFVQYCVHSFPRKHEAGVLFYTQKTLSATWALTVYLPGKSCLLSNCFLLWKVTDWKQKLTFPVSYMNL